MQDMSFRESVSLLKPVVLSGVVALASACSTPRLQTANTAAEQFAALKGNGQRAIAKNFYELGKGDEVKQLYWARHNTVGWVPGYGYGNSNRANPGSEDSGLKRRYINLPVPTYRDADGTVREEHLEVVEVVQ
jgi:hypothetical protein